MRAVVMVKPGQVEVRELPDPQIIEPTDAILRIKGACICGSDLWPYRGLEAADHNQMGHEYVGIVEQVGSAVTSVKPGDLAVGSFCLSCGECQICKAGYPSRCIKGRFFGGDIGTQAQKTRVPLAQHSLIALKSFGPAAAHSDDGVKIDPSRLRSYTAASDVLGTGWFGAKAAEVKPGKTVAVIGDGAVGLMAVLASKQLGAQRIIAMSRHADRQALAIKFGATDIVEARGEAGIAKVKELTGGLGVDCAIEAVGFSESMAQATGVCRPGGHVSFVGVPHQVKLDGGQLFFSQIHLHGGPAPVRNYLPELVKLIDEGAINPGQVFTTSLPLSQAAEGYRLMDERKTIKVFLEV